MSRIERLIQDLCPDGVEFVTLASVAKSVPGLTGKTKADFSDGNARYVTYKNAFSNSAVDDAAPDFVKVEEGERQNSLRLGDVVITGSSENVDEVGMSSVVVREPVEPLYLNSFCFALRFEHPILLPEFSKYLFRGEVLRKQIRKSASGVTRINVSKTRFMKVRIPVPPLEVQREIVRVLHQFTQLEAELEAELEARRAQYEHYRNAAVGKRNFFRSEWVPLSNVTDIRTGSKPPAILDSGPVSYINAGNEPSGFTSEPNAHGNVITMPSRGQGGAGHVGYQSVDFWCGPLCYRIESTTDLFSSRFLYHYLKNIQEELVGLRKVGSIPAVNKSDLGRVLIPVVGLREQKRVIALLDRFDALVNDISIGLPAELAARRKQYEHYRDRLLTFKELAA